MATEERVVSDKKKIGAKGGASDGDTAESEAGKKGSKKKVGIIAGVALVAAAAGYYFFFMPSDAATTDAAGETVVVEEEHEAGSVLMIDAVSINLAGGHYLRLGFALQLTADVHEEPDTARALDLAIDLFSQKAIEDVNDLEHRAELKAELLHGLEEAYEGEVMDVYFTDFVSQ